MNQIRGFTTRYTGLSRTLVNKVKIGEAFTPNLGQKPDHTKLNEYDALWDTGATGSVITNKLAVDCGLVPVGGTIVNTAGGTQPSLYYFVSMWLPNMVCFPQIKVTQGVLKDINLLIGMDIIGKGDFAVNNSQGVTSFTYRTPSLECFDFTQPPGTPAHILSPNIDQPCPCGSNKPFRECHGKPRKRGRR